VAPTPGKDVGTSAGAIPERTHIGTTGSSGRVNTRFIPPLRDVNEAGDVDGVGIVSHDHLDRFVHLGLMGTVTVVR
jgi:hypothetical protein